MPGRCSSRRERGRHARRRRRGRRRKGRSKRAPGCTRRRSRSMATARRGRPSRLAEEGRRARGRRRRRRRTERSRHRRSRTPAARRLRWHSARAYSTASRTRHHSRDRLRRRCVSGGRGRRPVVRVRSQQTQRDQGRCRLRAAVDEEAASAWHERHRWVTHGGGGGGNLSSSVGVEGDVRGGGRASVGVCPKSAVKFCVK